MYLCSLKIYIRRCLRSLVQDVQDELWDMRGLLIRRYYTIYYLVLIDSSLYKTMVLVNFRVYCLLGDPQ